MKKIIIYIGMAVLMITISSARAQANDSILTHYVGLTAHIGYDNMFTQQPELKDVGGVGGGIGFLYKFQYRPWRFQTGILFSSLNSLSKGKWQTSEQVTDPYPTMMWNNQYENVKYKRHAIAMAIPLMAGYKWRDWTFMLGLNAAMPVWQTASFAGDHTTTIKDEQLYDEFQNMPNHGLTTTPFFEIRPKTMNFDLALQAEVVWDLDKYLAYKPKKNVRSGRRKKSFQELLHYEASLFASYGVINSGVVDDPLNSLFVGARFAVFYEFEHPKAKKKAKAKAVKKTSAPARPAPKKKKTTPPTTATPVPPPPVVQDTLVYGEQTITKGEKIVLQNLYFATDKTNVLPQSQEALDELYLFLSENPEVRICILGHTDNTASAAYNLRLSQGRADAVKNEMVNRGIDPSRIETQGKGMSEPVADNNTPEGRQQNRRVEFIIL